MSLRLAGPGDAALLAAIHAEAFPAGAAWSASSFATLLGMPGAFGLVEDADALLLLRQAADEAEVLTLAVRPGARRRGLARGLMQAGMELLAARGARSLLLEVEGDNDPARALYAGLDFAQAGRRPDYYAPGRHALLLRRELG